MAKKYWLFKSDADDYPIEKIIKDKVTAWEGVRNYQARNFMMNEMQVGDQGIFYHSNAEPPCAMGVVGIASSAKPDKLQFDKKSHYYDEGATKQKPRWFCVDVKFIKKFVSPVTLEEMKSESSLAKMTLLQRGNRLSILPVTENEFKKICAMGGI